MFGPPCDLRPYVRSADVLENSRTDLARRLAESLRDYDARAARVEGWTLGNVPLGRLDDPLAWLECGVEAIPEGPLDDDYEADVTVICGAVAGNPLHRAALEVHLLANALRFMIRGRRYVDSRHGPRYHEPDYSDEVTVEQIEAIRRFAFPDGLPETTPVGPPGW